MSKGWRNELGENWEEIHQKYLHTIGNLTITGYNAELGDLPFVEKCDRPGGFAKSPVWLNHEISKLDHWNKDEIEKRAQRLTELAIQIWPAPLLESSILEKYKANRRVESTRTYTEEDHLLNSDDNTDRLYYNLKNNVLQLGNDITVNPVRNYIGFARDNNFMAIRFRRSYLLVDLITNEGFEDPKRISQATKRYGGRIRRVRVGNESIISDLMFLVKQTYEKGSSETKRITEEIKVYDENELLRIAEDKTKDLYHELKSSILKLGKDIEVRPTKMYITFRRSVGFVGVIILKSKLKVYLNIDISRLNDPLKKARDVKTIGHYSHGDTEITIQEIDEIPYALELIKQTYQEI